MDPILFSRPFHSPAEIQNVAAVLATDHVHGDGPFTASASARLKEMTGAAHALLTTSGTHALEMAVRLVGVRPGDEVILPSFTFSSGATAIVAAGATPVFVDMDPVTGNIAADQIEAAIMGIAKLGGLTPRGIRTHLGLNKPIYRKTAAYGHFGRKAEGDFFPWERTDLVEDLKAALA